MTTRLYVAVDTPDVPAATALALQLSGSPGLGIKLGLEFFGATGPEGIRAVKAAAASTPIFLDLKFHDIPNTVAGVVRSITPLAPAMITLHASGGPSMMKAAVRSRPTHASPLCMLT
jgi:orotidine-5'-phosphate decarboxylase